jgi:hypothetical protein
MIRTLSTFVLVLSLQALRELERQRLLEEAKLAEEARAREERFLRDQARAQILGMQRARR